MLGIGIALLSGALMSIQGVWNTEVTKQTSLWVAAGWVQATALITCLVIWFLTGHPPVAELRKVTPVYTLAGGILGAGITYTVIRSVKDLGPARSTLLIVIAQILVSYGIELFGLFGVEREEFSWTRLVGAALAVGGITVFFRNK